MRHSETIAEGARNFRASPRFHVVAVILFSVSLAGGGLVEQHEYQRFIGAWDVAVDNGANVFVVSDPDGPLRSDDCARVTAVDGVLRTGQVAELREGTFGSAPGDQVRVSVVSVDYLRIIAPSFVGSTGGVVVGDGARMAFGASAGGTLILDGLPYGIVDELPSSLRAPDRARWAMLPTSALQIDDIAECWIEVEPSLADTVPSLVLSYFEGSGSVRIDQAFNADLRELRSTWDQRVSRYSGVVSGVAAALLFYLVLVSWRQSVALYLLLGASRLRVALMMLSTGLLSLIVSGLLALVFLVLATLFSKELVTSGLLIAALTTLSGMAWALVALPALSLLGSLVGVADALRTRSS